MSAYVHQRPTNCAVIKIGDRYFQKIGRSGQVITANHWMHACLFVISCDKFEFWITRDIWTVSEYLKKKGKKFEFMEVDLKASFKPVMFDFKGNKL